MMRKNTYPEVLAVGELLVDLISTSYAETLDDVTAFERLPGGSPANMAGNLRRLGHAAGLVATVGNDDMGTFLLSFVKKLDLHVQGVRREDVPTTLILITKSKQVSNFEAYRMADSEIMTSQLPTDLLQSLRVFHTTCFALSREPARSAILGAARRVHEAGGDLSIDANFAEKIWPNQNEARNIVTDFCSMGALVKFSDVDWQRLYGQPISDPKEAADFLHSLGAKIVSITLGEKGCFVSNGTEQHFIPARPISVQDTTGAGDAFWSGFLSAYLDHFGIYECGLAGRKMAEIKLQHFGPLASKVDKKNLYLEFAEKL